AAVCERLLELTVLEFDSCEVDSIQPAHPAVGSEHSEGLIYRRANVREGLGRTPHAGERESIQTLSFDDARMTGIVVVVLQRRAIRLLADRQRVGGIATVLYGQCQHHQSCDAFGMLGTQRT